jgi:hypothetical protein
MLPLWTIGYPWNALFHFSFLILKTVSRTPGLLGQGISPSQGCYLHRTAQTQNELRQTSMPWVVFEPTIPVFERAKTVYALDHVATVIGYGCMVHWKSTDILEELNCLHLQGQLSWARHRCESRWQHCNHIITLSHYNHSSLLVIWIWGFI